MKQTVNGSSFGIKYLKWDINITLTPHPYKVFAISANGKLDTLAFVPNEHYGITISGRQERHGDSFIKFFYQYNDDLYFKGNRYNDLIWRLSGKNPIPYAFINMGKYKTPVEYQSWFNADEFNRHKDRYRGVSAVQEDDHYFFMHSHSFDYSDNPYIVFDKKTKKGFTTRDRNGNTGLTDDILGGPPIFPHLISGDYYFDAIEAYQLLEIIDAGNYTPAAPLKDLLSRINDDTNQLLIMFRKKNNK